jgi:hypothetical protein
MEQSRPERERFQGSQVRYSPSIHTGAMPKCLNFKISILSKRIRSDFAVSYTFTNDRSQMFVIYAYRNRTHTKLWSLHDHL